MDPAQRILLLGVMASAIASASGQPTQVLPAGTSPGADGAAPGTTSAQPVTVAVEPAPEPVRHHDAAALSVLEASERAIADLGSFRSTVTLTPRSVFKGTNPEGSAVVIARRSPDDPTRWQVRITGPITPDRANQAIEVDASFDGAKMKYVDHDNRLVGARVVPVRMDDAYFRVPAALWEHELWIRPDPFREIRGAETMTLEPRQTIDGVECDVVRGVLPGGQTSQMVAIGVSDHLPRRFVEGFEFRMAPGAEPMRGENTFEYTGLDPGVSLSDTDFVLPSPEGYNVQNFPVQNPVGSTPPTNLAPKPASEDGGSEGATLEGDSAAIESGEDESSAAVIEQTRSQAGRPVRGESRRPGPLVEPLEASMAPGFEATDAQGQLVRSSDLAGKPAVIVFWGSWSPWARDLSVALAPVAEEVPDAGLLVVGVRERSVETATQRLASTNLRATFVPMGDQVAAMFEVSAVPTVIVLDARGRIVLRHAGYNAARSPIQAVRRALGVGE